MLPPGEDPTDPPRRPAPATSRPVSNDVRPEAAAPAAAPSAGTKPTDHGWKNSSRDLVTGLEVTDFSETISGEIFDELFRR